MSLLKEISANIIGGTTFGGYFTNVTVENTTTLNGDIVLGGDAVSTNAPTGAQNLWLVVEYEGAEYKIPLTANT